MTAVAMLACNLLSGGPALAPAIPTAEQSPASPILENLTCTPPCWNGIVPGQTLKQDTLDLLNGIKTEKDEIAIKEIGDAESVITLYLHISGKMISDVQQRINFMVVNDLVQEIYFEGELSTDLDQAIDTLGEPEGVINLPYPVELLLLYPSKGIILFPEPFSNNSLVDRDTLKPESTILKMIFFDPANWDATIGENLVERSVIDKYMVPWDEYGVIDEKYPEPDWFGK